MSGKVRIIAHGKNGFRVEHEPKAGRFDKRFYRPIHHKPLDQAIGFAAMAAAFLEYELEDCTGSITAPQCAALVADRRRKLAAQRGEPHLRSVI